MRTFAILLIFILIASSVTLSQNYQVTNIQGKESLDPPVLDIYGSIARITHNTNFRFYSFPVAGPTAPTPMSSALHPAAAYGPYNVAMKSMGNNVVICYIDYGTTPSPGYWLVFVSSTDGGATWVPPVRLECIDTLNTLSLLDDNVILARVTSGMGTALLYYRDFADHGKIHMSNNHGFTSRFGPVGTFPAGDSLHSINYLSCFATTISGSDNIFSLYQLDSSLYMIRHTPPAPPGTAVRILSAGMTQYYQTHLSGNPNGLMYMSYGFMHWNSMMDWGQGTVLYKSTDYGNSWLFADTLAGDPAALHDLRVTSTGTLVVVRMKNSNIYLTSTLDGKHWSGPTQVNLTDGSASGKNKSGFSSALIDDNNIGVAWIDTTTGNDEIFYRKMAIPTAPTVGIADNHILQPAEFGLDQNYPNPFNPSTTIRYGLPNRSSVRLVITNALGQQVAVLENGEREAGYHDVEWRANIASGIYFYRVDAVSTSDPNNRFVQVKKMLLLK